MGARTFPLRFRNLLPPRLLRWASDAVRGPAEVQIRVRNESAAPLAGSWDEPGDGDDNGDAPPPSPPARHRALVAPSASWAAAPPPCVSEEHYLPTLLASYDLDHQVRQCTAGPRSLCTFVGRGGWRSELGTDSNLQSR